MIQCYILYTTLIVLYLPRSALVIFLSSPALLVHTGLPCSLLQTATACRQDKKGHTKLMRDTDTVQYMVVCKLKGVPVLQITEMSPFLAINLRTTLITNSLGAEVRLNWTLHTYLRVNSALNTRDNNFTIGYHCTTVDTYLRVAMFPDVHLSKGAHISYPRDVDGEVAEEVNDI